MPCSGLQAKLACVQAGARHAAQACRLSPHNRTLHPVQLRFLGYLSHHPKRVGRNPRQASFRFPHRACCAVSAAQSTVFSRHPVESARVCGFHLTRKPALRGLSLSPRKLGEGCRASRSGSRLPYPSAASAVSHSFATVRMARPTGFNLPRCFINYRRPRLPLDRPAISPQSGVTITTLFLRKNRWQINMLRDNCANS